MDVEFLRLDRLSAVRDALLVEVDRSASHLLAIQTHERYSHRMHLAAVAEAWRILDREVTRLAEEE